jgi:hypothetical protein
VRLHHPSEGWFSLKLLNKWGGQEKGMIQTPYITGNPEVTYTNPSAEANAVFVVVDDPGWMSGERNLYTLKFEKSWKTQGKSSPETSMAMGVWGAQPQGVLKPLPQPPEKSITKG